MRSSSRIPALFSFILIMIVASSSAFAQGETYSFVSRLGVDTLAVERVIISGEALKAEVLVRTPQTMLARYELRMDTQGMLEHLETSSVDPLSGKLQSREIYERAGDSLRIESVRGERRSVETIRAPKDALPFFDMVHWPFDLMLRQMRQRGQTEWNAPLVGRGRISVFPLAFTAKDSATVTHPTRGTMKVLVSHQGAIRTLDATGTTRALIVTKGGDQDVNALAMMYAKRDAAGMGLGALSGRDTTHASVLGADIMVEYGTPVKRGRVIWGKLVRYGELWRTGANRATHFKTSKPLRFAQFSVPPGEYTLFSIPEKNGGVLIINGQTGQNGQQYDEARDIGRVAMNPRALGQPVEVFSIRIDEVAGEGLLRLQWDETEYVAEFEVER